MNYQKIYNNLIVKAKSDNRIKLKRNDPNYVYYENHHIIPRCLNGDSSKENLILLTAKEHFVAHKLLVEINPQNKSLKRALWFMCVVNRNNKRTYRISSREYNTIRENSIKILVESAKSIEQREHLRKINTGIKFSEERKQNISKAKTGVKLSKTAKENIRKSLIGRVHSEETKRKIGLAQIGDKNHMRKTGHTDEAKEKIRIASTGSNNPMYGKTGINSICYGRIGELHPMFGKHHSKEVKDKISKSSKEANNRLDSMFIYCKYCNKKLNVRGYKIHEIYCKENLNREVNLTNREKPKKVTCPHCGKIGGSNIMHLKHFDNCKFKII